MTRVRLSKKKVDALFRLKDIQRRHFNMKRGFRFANDVAPIKSEYLSASEDLVDRREKELYADVPDRIGVIWRPGLGGRFRQSMFGKTIGPTLMTRLLLMQTLNGKFIPS
jgi:hypothetical protein